MVILQAKSRTKFVDDLVDDLEDAATILQETVEESGQQQNNNHRRVSLLIIYSIIKLSYSMGNHLWVPAQQEMCYKHCMLCLWHALL